MSGGWNTIESDAGVFTYLLSSLGVRNVQFEELVSLDSSSLSALDPIGIIFLFKYQSETGSGSSGGGDSDGTAAGKPRDGTFDHAATDPDAQPEPLWFAAQTIQNACGTQALLSVLMNKSGKQGVELGDTLAEFRDFTSVFDASLRGEALSNSSAIRDAHNAFARSSPFISDETRLATDDDDVYHFIAYTSVHGTLYELDGLQRAPISHGACTEAQFAERVIPVLQRRIERYPANEIRFNLLAMCKDLRVRAREIGDQEGLYREEEKRRAWRWENALRRHNFVGFIGELAKGVVAEKVDAGGYEKWVDEAKGRTKAAQAASRARGGAGDMDID